MPTKLWPRLGAGFVAGGLVAYVDNYLFQGEVSPIVIVVVLLAATATFGAFWGRSGWLAAATAWAFVPLPHLIKHLLGLPDTLHPNTIASIGLLAGFTFVVALVGTGSGLLLRSQDRRRAPRFEPRVTGNCRHPKYHYVIFRQVTHLKFTRR